MPSRPKVEIEKALERDIEASINSQGTLETVLGHPITTGGPLNTPEASQGPGIVRLCLKALIKDLSGLLRLVRSVRPDVIVSVYPVTTEVLGGLRRRGRGGGSWRSWARGGTGAR